MNKFCLKYLFFISASFFIMECAAVAQKPWTFLVYIAAANDLNQRALVDLEEMMHAGSNQNVNVIVYVTLHEEGQPKQTRKLYVNKGSVTQIGESMMRDSGHMATLVEALQWATVDYPSEHIAVVVWNHGSGPLNRSKKLLPCKGVCYDFDTSHYLTDRDCLRAFSWIRDMVRGGKKFDIIAFDAGLLASLEMAYTLSSCADYMVASEGVIPDDGYRYAYILNQCATKVINPLSFAQLMVRAYNQEHDDTIDYVLSATDLNACSVLVENCNAVAQILAYQLKGKNGVAVKAALKRCTNGNNCPAFDHGIYIDLCQFYRNMLKSIAALQLSQSIEEPFRELLMNGIKLFPTVIKAHVASKNYKQVGGLSIYFSRYSLDPSYYGLYWTENNPNWLRFLEAYLT